MISEPAADYRRYLASVVLFHLAPDAVGLGATDYQASSILDLDGPMTAGQLASRLGLSTGATTRLIDRMERSCYLRRTRDASATDDGFSSSTPGAPSNWTTFWRRSPNQWRPS